MSVQMVGYVRSRCALERSKRATGIDVPQSMDPPCEVSSASNTARVSFGLHDASLTNSLESANTQVRDYVLT